AGGVLERLRRVDEVAGKRLPGLAGEARAVAVGHRAQAARGLADVVVEVVDLVEDRGPVEQSLPLLQNVSVREGAVHRRRLARAGGEDPGDVVGEAARVAAAAAVPGRVVLSDGEVGVVAAVARPAAAAGEEEAAAALDLLDGGVLTRREGLGGRGERLGVAELDD